jgi:hypothetical protein
LREELDEITADVLAEHELAELRAEWSKIEAAAAAWRGRAESTFQGITDSLEAEALDPDEIEWPEPKLGDEDPDRGRWS